MPNQLNAPNINGPGVTAEVAHQDLVIIAFVLSGVIINLEFAGTTDRELFHRSVGQPLKVHMNVLSIIARLICSTTNDHARFHPNPPRGSGVCVCVNAVSK